MRTDRKASCEGKVDNKYDIEESGKKKQREKYEQLQKNNFFISFQYEHREHAVK